MNPPAHNRREPGSNRGRRSGADTGRTQRPAGHGDESDRGERREPRRKPRGTAQSGQRDSGRRGGRTAGESPRRGTTPKPRTEGRGARIDRAPGMESRTNKEAVQPPPEVFPAIPEDISATDLDREIRAELRPLSKTVADAVARRLVAAGELLDSEPVEALAHATAARRLAPRISAVREALGLAAYRAGKWKLAISELRTYQRLSGRQTHLAVIADCERALGRPERAIDLYRSADARAQSPEDYAELIIVASGARRDLGQAEAAAAMLQLPALRDGPREPWVARLRYAFAESLLESGDERRARQWLQRAVDADLNAETGAAERLLELDGVLLDDAEPEQGDFTE